MFITPVGTGDKQSNLARIPKHANGGDFAHGRRLGNENSGNGYSD
jgi:hypothetical protein